MSTDTAVRKAITVAVPQEKAFSAFDADLWTEVEVTFTPEGPDRTRVELEHRGLDAYGDKAQEMRDMFDSPGAWQTTLEQYAQAALAEA